MEGMRTMLRRCVTLWVFAVLAVIGVACGSSPTATLSPGPLDPQEADALRELAFAYWEAFNAYDADKALGYLEEEYRQQRDEEIRGEIGSIKLFGIKLGVSEKTPPSIVSNDEREMYLTMKEPLGERRIRMAFREVKGEWRIIFAEEAK
jgi:hypothetical protein